MLTRYRENYKTELENEGEDYGWYKHFCAGMTPKGDGHNKHFYAEYTLRTRCAPPVGWSVRTTTTHKTRFVVSVASEWEGIRGFSPKCV